jgi:hypothetical protein
MESTRITRRELKGKTHALTQNKMVQPGIRRHQAERKEMARN